MCFFLISDYVLSTGLNRKTNVKRWMYEKVLVFINNEYYIINFIIFYLLKFCVPYKTKQGNIYEHDPRNAQSKIEDLDDE